MLNVRYGQCGKWLPFRITLERGPSHNTAFTKLANMKVV
jgi:hypothetical protein